MNHHDTQFRTQGRINASKALQGRKNAAKALHKDAKMRPFCKEGKMQPDDKMRPFCKDAKTRLLASRWIRTPLYLSINQQIIYLKHIYP